MRGTAVAGWTGRGSLGDLVASAKGVLRSEEVRARVEAFGGSVIVSGQEPVLVASLLKNLPGTEWVAVGGPSGSVKGLSEEVGRLARTYLGRGRTFAIRAESRSAAVKPSDIAAAGIARVLGVVKGARVNEDAPSVVFRAVFDGRHGAAAVELSRGPGGTPTGREVARCLVSGGIHSSVVAWNALLSGFRVEMIHAKASEATLAAVARLYAELSHRVDPRALRLVVLEGGGVKRALTTWVRRHPGVAFAGFHAECRGGRAAQLVGVRSPLYLLPEREFEAVSAELGTKPERSDEAWREGGDGASAVRRFGGVRADIHGVLDGLRRSSR